MLIDDLRLSDTLTPPLAKLAAKLAAGGGSSDGLGVLQR
jgi:hypothetical protein